MIKAAAFAPVFTEFSPFSVVEYSGVTQRKTIKTPISKNTTIAPITNGTPILSGDLK